MTIITNRGVQSDSTAVAVLQIRDDTLSRPGWTRYFAYPAAYPTPAARTFADEKGAFDAALPLLLSRYAGQWVAISGGQVADHDRDRKALTRRFFQGRTRGPVYIGYVGGAAPGIRQATPFRGRRRA